MAGTIGVGSSAPGQASFLNPIAKPGLGPDVAPAPTVNVVRGIPGVNLNQDCGIDAVYLEYHVIAYPGILGFVDLPIILSRPCTSIIMVAAGPVNSGPLVFLSVAPTGIDPNGGNPILNNGDVNAIPFPKQGDNRALAVIKFCKPVQKIFVTAQAQGVPGQNITLCCTSDVDEIKSSEVV